MVEIDRGTMPVKRSDPEQTSFEGKMRVYLAAHAAKQHERQFGWKNFRVLTVTTDRQRVGIDDRRVAAAPRSAQPRPVAVPVRHVGRSPTPAIRLRTDGQTATAGMLP